MAAIARRSLALGAAAALLTRGIPARAAIPVQLQVDLFLKLATYDKTLRARAADEVRTLVVTRSGDPESERLAYAFQSQLRDVERIADLPHSESSLPYTNANELAAFCRQRRIATVYVTPEVGQAAAETIASAFTGLNILTMTPTVDLVRRGLVLGFELVSSKPKLFINLPQAQKQGIVMAADLLKLMTVLT